MRKASSGGPLDWQTVEELPMSLKYVEDGRSDLEYSNTTKSRYSISVTFHC